MTVIHLRPVVSPIESFWAHTSPQGQVTHPHDTKRILLLALHRARPLRHPRSSRSRRAFQALPAGWLTVGTQAGRQAGWLDRSIARSAISPPLPVRSLVRRCCATPFAARASAPRRRAALAVPRAPPLASGFALTPFRRQRLGSSQADGIAPAAAARAPWRFVGLGAGLAEGRGGYGEGQGGGGWGERGGGYV